MQIEKVGVAGFNDMGFGISLVVARSGFAVSIWDTDEARKALFEGLIDNAVKAGTLSSEDKEALLSRIILGTDLPVLKDADLVIESLGEDVALKRRFFADVSHVVGEDAILATHTSCHSVTEICQAAKNPQRSLGMHFFKPPEVVKLVEVVKAEKSSPNIVDQACDFCRKIGKEPVLAKDLPGFIVNYLWAPYMNQALEAYDQGLATKEDLDLTLEMGLGYPKGPLKLIDQVGLDNYLEMTSAFYEESKDPKFAPPVILKRMVKSGKTGKKVGEGFYLYHSDHEE